MYDTVTATGAQRRTLPSLDTTMATLIQEDLVNTHTHYIHITMTLIIIICFLYMQVILE